MKKFLFIICSSIFSVFLLVGCSDDSDDNKVTQPTLSDINSLQGTYKVEFFGTDAMVGYITTNCDKANELGYATNNNKPIQNEDGSYLLNCNQYGEESNAIMYGNTVTAIIENNEVVIKSKMQLYHLLMSMSENDTYQYLEYAPLYKEKGEYLSLKGRNLIESTSVNGATYDFQLQEDGTILHNLSFVKIVDTGFDDPMNVTAKTTIILRKVSDTVEPIDANKLFVPADEIENENAKAIFEKFKTNVESDN